MPREVAVQSVPRVLPTSRGCRATPLGIQPLASFGRGMPPASHSSQERERRQAVTTSAARELVRHFTEGT